MASKAARMSAIKKAVRTVTSGSIWVRRADDASAVSESWCEHGRYRPYCYICWRDRAEAAEQQYENLLRAGEDQTAAFDECRDKLAGVREWAEEHDSITGNPWVIQCAREVLAILDEGSDA